MFNQCRKVISCIVVIFILSTMTFVSFAGGWWDLSSASDWAFEELDVAFNEDLVPVRVSDDFQNLITRAEFASLVVRLYERLTGDLAMPAPANTFSDTTDEDVLKANVLGVVSGRGDGTFAPEALVTRQEMAIMYYKALDEVYKVSGKILMQTDGVLTMNDKSQVAEWAVKFVDYVYENDIIKGSEGNFNPIGNASREQAIVVLKRVYEKFKIESEQLSNQSSNVHDLDSVFTFVSNIYPNYTRADFDKWKTNYFDLNQNGSDEVIFTTTYYDGNLNCAIVITADDGVFKEVPSFISLAKYENNMSFKDGFLVHETKDGGTGISEYNMNLYIYDDYRLIDVLDDTVITQQTVAVSEKDNFIINSEFDGDLKDFMITLTKTDNETEEVQIISQERYTYDKEGQFFRVKPISILNTAKSFDDVYNGNNLRETIEYFSENLYNFSESTMKEYSKKMIGVINQDIAKLSTNGDFVLSNIPNESYNLQTGEMDVSKLSENDKEVISFIQNSNVYSLAKLFYANEGKVDEGGFAVSIDYWLLNSIKPALDIVYPERNTPYEFTFFDPLCAPNFQFVSAQQVENAPMVYPNVLVHSYEEVKILEGADTWKTTIILPIQTRKN